MPGETEKGVVALYSESLKRYGRTSMAVGWRDHEAQRLRFEKLTAVIGSVRSSRGISVNDLGCGYGAMFHYLAGLSAVKLRQYVGYDISPDMLAEARRTIQDPRAMFVRNARVSRRADYSFVSGTFNVKLDASDAEWTEYVKERLLELAAMSRHGFAFNALTVYVAWKRPHLYYADPLIFFDFCKRHISPCVSLFHDYPLFEWTITVRNGRR